MCVTIHLFPNIKSSPTGSSTESTVKQVMVLGEPSMFEFEGFLNDFPLKTTKIELFFFSSSNHFSTAMRDIDLTQNGKNIKHFAWKQRPTHKYSSLCVVPFESPDTLIKLKKNYLTVCNVIKALLAPSVAMFTQRCSHIKAHEHSKWSFVSRGPVRTEYFYQHCPWSLTVCSGRTSVCTLCPQFRRGWPNKSL